MKYIVNSEEVSRDTFYFCKRAKEENKTFELLKTDTYVDGYINEHPEYDYYIRDDLATYYTKGDEDFREWYEKDTAWYTSTPNEMTKRYNRSRFKNILTFEQWYTKNGWERKSETKYTKETHAIPAVGYCIEANIETKLFSVTVTHSNTVMAINKLREKYGDFCIEYVLRDGASTEIIYKDTYLEI